MARDGLSGSTEKLVEALERMLAALQILDELEAPGDIGSHLDLAIAKLRRRLGLAAESGPPLPACFSAGELDLAGVDAAIADAPDRGVFDPL